MRLKLWEDRWRAVPARWRAVITDVVAVLLWGGTTLYGETGAALGWAILAGGLLALRRPLPVPTLLAIVAIHGWSGVIVSPALACAAYTVASRARPLSGVPAIAASVLVFFIAPLDDTSFGRLFDLTFMVLLPVLLGLHMRRTWELLAAYEEYTQARQEHERLAAERAVLQERHRIAQEMHDSLGHKLSLIVLHAGALELSGPRGSHAELLRRTGQEAMHELRKVIGVLRADDEAGHVVDGVDPADEKAFRELVESSRNAGVPVAEDVDPEVWRLDPLVRSMAHRVVREALTNVHKHAGPVPTALRLQVRQAQLLIEVCNAAPGRERACRSAGARTGLATLAERVGMLGGELGHGTLSDGSYRLLVRIPVCR
ncbi:hypothetical protein GCM10012275_00740 [Longimycelium tulufanense]|uniref:histidine kinase n=1 Tax=Longimycelium tulufanense TaxID=907463 RepID=A0A8J3FS52_9PSEU|nr:histidine kinase [Longimycelium tulufanense]GGM33154.1 hypothetical protein GCM10012275_00740 [Longimycelium tulufanense]